MPLIVTNILHITNDEQFTCPREFTDLLELDYVLSQTREYRVPQLSSVQIIWRAPELST